MRPSTLLKLALVAFAAAPALAMPSMHEDIDTRDLSYDEIDARDLGYYDEIDTRDLGHYDEIDTRDLGYYDEIDARDFGYTDIDIRDVADSITARDIASAMVDIIQERALAGEEIDARLFNPFKIAKKGFSMLFGGGGGQQ